MADRVSTELPLTHPMRAAWEKYKTTADYANTRRWPVEDGEKHIDGALWAAFCKGWDARGEDGRSDAAAPVGGRNLNEDPKKYRDAEDGR